MEIQQQVKTKPLNKEGDRPPDESYVLRCPNPRCGKTHFSVVKSAVESAHFRPSCPCCGQIDRVTQHFVYESGGKFLIQAFCGVCRKEHSLSFLGIHRICERCGWEGDFFLGFPKMTA